MKDLLDIRNEIDGIDRQIVELFENRMILTTQVAEYKISTGNIADIAVCAMINAASRSKSYFL